LLNNQIEGEKKLIKEAKSLTFKTSPPRNKKGSEALVTAKRDRLIYIK
jgi:hypothetical protein